MNRLHLVLAEAELELVPRSIAHHPQVRKDAKRAGKRGHRRLLDSSVHHAAMRELDDGDRRGRPDLAHLFLLTALESRMNKADRLRVHVHTRHDERIHIDPETRLVRNYPRFVGLVEQLFRSGRVGPKDRDLLRLEEDVKLGDLVRSIDATRSVALDPAGSTVPPSRAVRELVDVDGDACVVIGGFPRGDYRSDIASAVDDVVGFGPDPLTVWTVASEVVVNAAAAALDPALD